MTHSHHRTGYVPWSFISQPVTQPFVPVCIIKTDGILCYEEQHCNDDLIRVLSQAQTQFVMDCFLYCHDSSNYHAGCWKESKGSKVCPHRTFSLNILTSIGYTLQHTESTRNLHDANSVSHRNQGNHSILLTALHQPIQNILQFFTVKTNLQCWASES